MGIRFWDTKFRYGISRCALRLGYEMLFGIRNDVRSYCRVSDWETVNETKGIVVYLKTAHDRLPKTERQQHKFRDISG